MSLAPRILVADDDPDIRDVLQQFLSNCGCQVETVADGEEALEAIQREPPDLVLLDLALPKLSGLEVLRRIKVGRMDVDVITISGHPVAGQHLGPDSVRLGATDFIMKPFDLDDLERKLHTKLRALHVS